MPPAKPIQKYRLTVKYPPSTTKTGGGFVKDEDGVKNFGDASLLNLEQGDVIDVERTHNAAKGGYDASFNIIKWSPVTSASHEKGIDEGAQAVARAQAATQKSFTRPRTDPKDQRQMWVTALMKEWMAAYAQSCSITTTGEMKPMDAGVVENAARVCGVVYDRLFGPMTQSGADIQEPREDMNGDAIPDWTR